MFLIMKWMNFEAYDYSIFVSKLNSPIIIHNKATIGQRNIFLLHDNGEYTYFNLYFKKFRFFLNLANPALFFKLEFDIKFWKSKCWARKKSNLCHVCLTSFIHSPLTSSLSSHKISLGLAQLLNFKSLQISGCVNLGE